MRSNCGIALRNADSRTTNSDANSGDNAITYGHEENTIKKLHLPSQENAALKIYEIVSSLTIDVLLLKFLTHKRLNSREDAKCSGCYERCDFGSIRRNAALRQLSLSTRSRRAKEVFRGRDQLRCCSAHKSCWGFASCALSGRTRRYL